MATEFYSLLTKFRSQILNNNNQEENKNAVSNLTLCKCKFSQYSALINLIVAIFLKDSYFIRPQIIFLFDSSILFKKISERERKINELN